MIIIILINRNAHRHTHTSTRIPSVSSDAMVLASASPSKAIRENSLISQKGDGGLLTGLALPEKLDGCVLL